MSLPARFVLINVLVAVVLVAQWGLLWHVSNGSDPVYPELRSAISDIPLEFPATADKLAPTYRGGWMGRSNAEQIDRIRKELPFEPDGLVSRTYVPSDSSLGLNLYMVYSRTAKDRKHHPEVCIRDVTGAAEDFAARKILYLDVDHKRPIQRFRFRTSPTRHTTVYYWHFTVPRIAREGETILQVLHQRLSQPAPSITIQVTTGAEPEQLDAIEQGFLVHLDQVMLAQHLPEGTAMGCDRLPIALLRR